MTEAPLGLRERKKIKTRRAIRREAFRLIEQNGFAATTVEQIAEAADVSPSTFFRYFPSKESLLLADDLDPLILEALKAQPRDLSPARAFRRAYAAVLAQLPDDQLEFESTRQRLMFSIPELKAAMYDEYYRTVTVAADGDRPPDRPCRRRFRSPGLRGGVDGCHDGRLRQRAEDRRHDLSGFGFHGRRHAAGLNGPSAAMRLCGRNAILSRDATGMESTGILAARRGCRGCRDRRCDRVVGAFGGMLE